MMTLSKLAKLANVSVSTASKAFSGSPEVNADTREMIFAIAKEQGCFKKFYNVKYPKLVVAIIAPEFNSAYYTRYLSEIRKHLEEKNCELCVSVTDFSAEREKDLMEYYDKHSNVDGVITIHSQLDNTEKYEIPTAFINPVYKMDYGFSVFSDSKSAIEKGVNYLIEKGVDKIGFVGEQKTILKQLVFKEILEEKGLTFEEDFVSISEKRFEEGGYEAMERLFAEKHLPRAIVCAYDYMAIGVIKSIYEHKLSVPEDIAILGMDDIPEAKYLNPSLASIATPVDRLCEMATEALIKQMNGEPVTMQKKLESTIHFRKSFEV